MQGRAAYLQQLDDTWGHAYESLVSILEGVDEPEAYWQAPCYAAEAAEDGWPAPGTIAWQVAHLAHCKRYYTLVYPALDVPSPAVPARRPLASYADERAALDAAHAAQREAIAQVDDANLERKAGDNMPLGEFIAMTARHDAWHAGQIAVVRRLYRTRDVEAQG